MNRLDFLSILDKGIGDLPYNERRDILSDYEEHFALGLSQGKSEEDIIANLGNPYAIAQEYGENYKAKMNTRPLDLSKEPVKKDDQQANANSKEQSQAKAEYSNPDSQNQQSSGKNPLNPWVQVAIIIGVVLLNVMFVVPFYLGIAGTLLGAFFVGLALIVASVALMMITFIHFSMLLFGLATLSIAILLIIGLVYVVKYLCIFTVWYCKKSAKLCMEGSF